MEGKHLLIKQAFIYPKPKEKPKLEGYVFIKSAGYWVDNENNEPYVLDNRRPKPQTKKADVETGEDQKGE
ncbi:hypothetical protein M3172_20605 [Mesobacillus subterraneus]|uniref:hypothetical protein n=1 Tax=Mesobacillus subterraneus TaxID=285983 RepID=UPI00203E5CBA|nr:hypothetical protein [Mesobacillus subterraneus]MCM3575597.1 hypothetical protein [Mesobacillus subterraneus]